MNPKAGQKSLPDECEKLGISKNDGRRKKTQPELSFELNNYFINVVHKGDVNSYNDSDCFQGKFGYCCRFRKNLLRCTHDV